MRSVPITEGGHRLGEGHPNCKHSDELVEQVRQMRDDGATYRQICHALCLPKSTVRDFVTYKRRACTVAGFRRVAD